jgi:hypothetical protein
MGFLEGSSVPVLYVGRTVKPLLCFLDDTQTDTPHSAGLLSTCERPARDLYFTTHTNHERRYQCPWWHSNLQS